MKEMVGGCCVCSDDRGWPENPLVYCDGQSCTVAVHQACYGIVTVPTGPWYCRKCESQERAVKVKCELCPSKYGALKRTDNGGWAHVVCALYIPEVRFGNVTTMEPIQLQLIPQERFNKVCYICEEGSKSSVAGVGACMQCNKSGCKQQFHVTCAQGLGLLCEEAGNYLDNVKYCGYCQHHYSKLKKGINIKTIPPYKPLPSEIQQSDSSSEKETDGSGGTVPSSGGATTTGNQVSSGASGGGGSSAATSSSATGNSASNSGGTATGAPSTPAGVAQSTATTGKRKYYSNSKAKIEKTTANSNQTSSTTATSSKTYQKKTTNLSSSSSTTDNTTANTTANTKSSSSSSSSSSSAKNNNQSNNKLVSGASNSSNISGATTTVTVNALKADEQAATSFKVEVKVEVKKEVEDAVAAAAAASTIAAPITAAGKGKKRKANSRTPTPNATSAHENCEKNNSDCVGDSVVTKKEKDAVAPESSKKTKPSDVPTPTSSAPLLTPPTATVSTTQLINPPPQLPPQATHPTARGPTPTPPQLPTTQLQTNVTTTTSTTPSSTITTTTTTIAPAATLATQISQVNSLVVSVPLLPLVPSTAAVVHSVSPRPIMNERLTPTLTVDSRQQGGIAAQIHHQQVLSGSLDINGVTISPSGLLLEPDTMLTSELTGSGGLKIMFEKQPPPSSAVQAEIDRITPTTDAPMKRSRSQSMEKNDKIMRSSKKRGSNGLANMQQQTGSVPPSAPSPVAGSSAGIAAAAGLSAAAAATPPPSIVSTVTKRASRSQHPTPPPTLTVQQYAQQSGSSGMLGISLSATNQIKDSPPSSPSSESLGAPPVTVGRKKGRKSAPASVSSSSSSNTAKDTKDNIKLFQNGVHAPHMLGNQLNPNSNMAQKMSDHLNSELEAHSIFNSTESAALVGPQLHNRVLASARSSSTGGSSTASAGSGLSSMLGGGSGAIPQTLDQLLERQWEQGSQFLMEQAQHFDIASLLSCLHQLRAENTRLEEHVSSLLQRRDHLLAVNARLAIPLTGPPATPQSSHPHTVNNIHPSVAVNHADMNVVSSRSSRHSSSSATGAPSGGTVGYSSHGGPLENGLPAEAAYVQQHSQHRSPAQQGQGQAQPSPTIRHSSSNYGGSGSGSSANVSGLLRTTESSSGGGGGGSGGAGRSTSSSRSHQQQQQQQQQHYNMYQQTAQQQMSMRREADMHHQSSSKPS